MNNKHNNCSLNKGQYCPKKLQRIKLHYACDFIAVIGSTHRCERWGCIPQCRKEHNNVDDEAKEEEVENLQNPNICIERSRIHNDLL